MHDDSNLIYGIVDLAENIAIIAHRAVGQKRRYTNEDYDEHPMAVAVNVLMSSDYTDDETVCAALLHDVLEDTSVSYETLLQIFGQDIANLVKEVTDVSRPEDGNRNVRKAIDRAHLAKSSNRGATIKLADIIDNTKSIVKHDPKFAKVYMAEIRLLLEVLKHGDATLFKEASELVNDYYRINDNV